MPVNLSAREALRNGLATLGPFFAAEIHPPGVQVAPPWQSMGELVVQPTVLANRVASVRTVLSNISRRPETVDVDIAIAASVTHLGLVTRVVAPAIAATALGSALTPGVHDLWWQDQLGGPFPLSVAIGSSAVPTPDSAVEALTAAFSTHFAVSHRVLWGNVGSAINSANQRIAATRPDLASVATTIADDLLSDERIDSGDRRSTSTYRRRSCCLMYRVSPGGRETCGDCVLSH